MPDPSSATTLLGVAAVATTVLALAVAVLAGSARAGALTNNWYASAPYLMPESNNPPNPTTVMTATGRKRSSSRSSWRERRWLHSDLGRHSPISSDPSPAT